MGWCEDDIDKKADIIERFYRDEGERKRIEDAMDNLPVVFSSKKLIEMIEKDTKEFNKENGIR